MDRESHLDNAFYLPLLIMIAAFFLFFLALLLVRVRTEIRLRRVRAMRLAGAADA
jgi:heme exporter protein C